MILCDLDRPMSVQGAWPTSLPDLQPKMVIISAVGCPETTQGYSARIGPYSTTLLWSLCPSPQKSFWGRTFVSFVRLFVVYVVYFYDL